MVLAPCSLVVDGMPGNAIQPTAAATARAGDPSGDVGALTCHFELPGAQGGAGLAMEDLDGRGDADLSGITGDNRWKVYPGFPRGLPWVPVFSPVFDGFPCMKRSPLGSRVFIEFPQVPL